MSILGRVFAISMVVPVLASTGGVLGTDYNLDPNFTLPAFNGDLSIAACVVEQQGSILIAGSFATVNQRPAPPLVRVFRDGSLDAQFRPELVQGRDAADALLPLTNGQFIVAGPFGSNWEFRRYNPDGSRDGLFRPDVQPNGGTYLVEAADGSLIAVGRLSIQDPVARLDRNGKRLVMQFPFPAARDYYLEHVLLRANDKLILAGQVMEAASSSYQPFIAQVNQDGSIDHSFETQAFGGFVRAIVETSEGKLVFCSDTQVARANSDGTIDPLFKSVDVSDGYVERLALLGATNVAVLGNFPIGGGAYRSMLLLNLDGTLSPSDQFENWYRSLAIITSTGELIVQRSYDSARVMIVQKDGEALPAFAPLLFNGLGSPDLVTLGDAVLFAGGVSLSKAEQRLHKTSFTGTLDPLWESGDVQSIGSVTAFASDGLHRIYVAGVSDRDSSSRTQDLLRFTSTGQTDPTFQSVPLLSRWGLAVSILYPLADGGFFVGGSFDTVGGSPRKKLARILPDGRVDTAFDCGDLLENQFSFVYAISAQPDGGVLVGGQNDPQGGRDPVAVVRLKRDGAWDSDFKPLRMWSSTRKIITDSRGKAFICGDFTSLGDLARNGIALLNADGSVDTTFDAKLADSRTARPRVEDMILQEDGRLILTGSFDWVGTNTVNSLARLNPDGSLDTQFVSSAGLDGVGTKLAIGMDGSIFVSGGFSRAEAVERMGLAKYTPRPVLSAHSYDPGGAFLFSITGGMGKRFRIERSSDLRTWVVLGSYTPEVSPLEVVLVDPISPIQFYRVSQW